MPWAVGVAGCSCPRWRCPGNACDGGATRRPVYRRRRSRGRHATRSSAPTRAECCTEPMPRRRQPPPPTAPPPRHERRAASRAARSWRAGRPWQCARLARLGRRAGLALAGSARQPPRRRAAWPVRYECGSSVRPCRRVGRAGVARPGRLRVVHAAISNHYRMGKFENDFNIHLY